MKLSTLALIGAAAVAAAVPSAARAAEKSGAAGSGTTKVAAVGLSFQVPDGWTAAKPTSAMRKAQYTIPASKAGVEPAELVLFFFGEGQGGGAQANIDRWTAQFAPPSGSGAVAAKTDTLSVGSLRTTTADIAGTYVAERMPGSGDRQNKPGWRLLGAVVEGTGGPWFFKLTGPKETVTAAEAQFRALLKSMKAAG